MVSRKFLEPNLREMPHGNRRISRALCGIVAVLAWISADKKSGVLLWDGLIVVQGRNVPADEVQSEVGQSVVGEADLDWLLEVEHVHWTVDNNHAFCQLRHLEGHIGPLRSWASPSLFQE